MKLSYDVIGSIAILPLYTKNPKKIARLLLSKHKNIKTVFLKSGKITGRLRKPKLKFLSGIKTKETTHKESGCLMKLNVEDCYFSPRLSNDRLLIAKKVKRGEKILVMFAGIGPYAIVIAKNSKPEKIYAIEINKKAAKYAEENTRLNKFDNIIIMQGDVKRIIPRLQKKIKFDRIVMPRPQLKESFLREAFSVARKGCVIHFHDFLQEDEIPDAAIDKIQKAVQKAKRKFKIIRYKKAGEIAPYRYRIRIDFIVL